MLRFALRMIEGLIITAILLYTFSSTSAIAQTTCGELIGQVFDPSGNILPGSKVTITNMANGNTRSRVTDKSGYYRVLCLPPGNYKIIASKEQYLDSGITFAVQLNQKNIVEAPDITLRLATLTGKILDSGGIGFLNASVTIINESNGEARAALTDENGSYSVIGLAPGNYRVIASMTGSDVESAGPFSITVDGENVVASPIILVDTTGQSQTTTPPAGQVKESAGRAQLVRTTDAARSSNFTQRQLTSLPVGGATYMRSFDELALLVAGVAPPPYTPGVRGPGVGFGIGTAGTFSVNGARARSNNFTIDGSDNNDPDVGVRRQGFVALVPQSLESINDFSISTLLWDAELGRNFGSQVNAVSRYGENKYHGQAYLFFTDSRLNARNTFDLIGGPSDGEDPFTRTQAGFTFGGPIARNRTQFFGSFERQVINASTEQHFSSPLLKERRFLDPPKFIVRSNRFPAGFGVPSGATPLGRNILSLYPLPNNPGGPYGENTYTEILPADGEGVVFSFRLTHQVTDRNAVNARYNFTDDSRILPSVNRAIRSTIGSDSRSQNLSLILDSEVTNTISSLARFSFGRTRITFPEHPTSPLIFSADSNEKVETAFGPRPVDSLTGPIGELIVEPFSPVGVNALLFPQGRVNNTFQFADTISWQLGVHSVKFGGDVRRVQLNSFQNRLYRPLVLFGNGVAREIALDEDGDPVSDKRGNPRLGEEKVFLGVRLAALGISSAILQTITAGTPDSTIGLRFTEVGFFLNDNWRARHNLTVDYGLRYEYTTVPREANNRIEDAITLRNLPTPASRRFDTGKRIGAFNSAVNAYRQIVGGRTGIYNPDLNNFGPHIGLAWDPLSDGKMSVRAGYGIYYDTILGAVVSQSRNVFPNEIPINIDPSVLSVDFLNLVNPAFLKISHNLFFIKPETRNQLNGAPGDFVALIGELFLRKGVGGGLAFTLPDKDLRTPYSQQWHATIERQIFDDYFISAAYVGTKGIKLTRLTTPNNGPAVTPTIPSISSNKPPIIFSSLRNKGVNTFFRPIPALGPYQIIEDTASSTYHALQFESRKRFNRSFIFTAAYTWSHAIDDVSDLFPIAGAPVLAQNHQELILESGDANFDILHEFAASFVWDLPSYSNTNSGIARWVSGWQVSAIIQAHTGQPFTLNLPVDANQDGNLSDRPSSIEKLIFYGGHGSRRVALQSGADINDFFQLGSDGFVGRNTVRGDGLVNFDVALNKSLPLKNDRELVLRVEVFNLLNRANYGIPIRTISAPGFGSSVETVNPARIVQFAVKYKF